MEWKLSRVKAVSSPWLSVLSRLTICLLLFPFGFALYVCFYSYFNRQELWKETLNMAVLHIVVLGSSREMMFWETLTT